MTTSEIDTVACVGAGVIGRGWAQVFLRAGRETRLWDQAPAQTVKARAWIEHDLANDAAEGVIDPTEARARLDRLSIHDDLAGALAGAAYVQESGPEDLAIKRDIFAAVDALADPGAILASSTSGLDISEIVGDIDGVARAIMAHPFNPPHVVPVVEVMAAQGTDPQTMTRTIEFLRAVGQQPVVINFYVPGFIINRLQAAVVREAIHLAESGVAEVDAIDACMRNGLGLRWAVFGTFGVNNTNADEGIRQYYRRFGGAYREMMADLDGTAPSFDEAMIERIASGVDAMEGGAAIADLCRWRDRMVRKIRTLKAADPHP